MEATKALQFKSLEEFKADVLGNSAAVIEVLPSAAGSKSPFWWTALNGAFTGTVDHDLDIQNQDIVVRMAEFTNSHKGETLPNGKVDTRATVWCMVAGRQPVRTF